MRASGLAGFLLHDVDATQTTFDGDSHPPGAVACADRLVRLAADAVPAYRELLQGNQHPLDFNNAPRLTKDNYFRAWSLPDRSWGGKLDAVSFCHTSSGSTGQPTVWARTVLSEVVVATTFERVLHDAFQARQTTTLCVIAFPLGSWVGGLFTTLCLNYLKLKGYKTVVVTPGNNVDDILRQVNMLGPHFEQTVLFGYPPFVKGVIDAGCAQGVPWPARNLGLVLAGEVFSEEWRRLVAGRAGISDPTARVMSLYGTADAGVIAAESPASAAIRAWLADHPAVSRELFKSDRLPTLCQYDPHNRLLETSTEDGTLVVTCLVPPALVAAADGSSAYEAACVEAGPPLIKYAIGDAGGFMSFDGMRDFVHTRGMDVDAVLADERRPRKLPFVWVFGRSFWCVSIYGANVFVENIMVGLEQADIAAHGTGKFVLFVDEDTDLNRRLAVRAELAPGTRDERDLEELVSEAVTHHLIRLNSEYANYVPAERQKVKVYLHAFGDPAWFPAGVKHKYTL